ncbi:MAG: CBS domain-containing protein [Desulfobacterales bacterium]|jgi:CBS domain-containing protein|nr:CBS domain-containing protein [Desulfobacterales bacterium]
MPVVEPRHVLSGIQVREAMRRHFLRLPAAASIAAGIARLLKFKANALVAEDDGEAPAGVVSKTDLIGAYYAGLQTATPLATVMNAPPLTCFPDDPLESALDLMGERRVHRLYVVGADPGRFMGVVSYTDVVALLYRYCRACARSTTRTPASADGGPPERLSVKDVMTAAVVSLGADAPLARVVEELSAYRFGAVLITAGDGAPAGVVSKTDLIRAYRQGVPLEADARSVMTAPVAVWDQDAPLYQALQYMFLKDVQRLFVHAGRADRIAGVLSLSDAARIRSGTCKACTLSRFVRDE